MPLILTRKRGQTLVVDGPCTFRFLEFQAGRITVEVIADKGVTIVRGELLDQPERGIDVDRPLRKVNGRWRYQPRGGD